MLPIILLCVLAIVDVADAVESDRLIEAGKRDFHSGRYGEALASFDRVVEAQPDNPYALHYRGVTRARMDDAEGAVSDLTKALAIAPELDQAKLDLGIALLEVGRYDESSAWLERAAVVPELEYDAILYLGIGQLRSGNSEVARASFVRAAREPGLEVVARYYAGIACHRLGDRKAAVEHFTFVTDYGAGTEVARQAANYLAGKDSESPPPFSAFAELGFQYDSNVVLAPADDDLDDEIGISGQADGRAIVTAGAQAAPLLSDWASAQVGYQFFQSLHFDLSDFNLQNHRASAQIVSGGDRLRVGLSSTYDFYLLDSDLDSFLSEAQALPWVRLSHGDFGSTELFYRMRFRDFLSDPFSRLRDGLNHSIGAQHILPLPRLLRSAELGYRFDFEDPRTSDGEQFAYDGHEVRAGMTSQKFAGFEGRMLWAFRYENYDPASGGRNDEENRVSATLERDLTDQLSLLLGYFGAFNASNDERFQYNRHIASISLQARF